MADVTSKAEIQVGARDTTGNVFADVGRKMGALQTASSSLSSGLAKLGLAGLGVASIYKLGQFMKSSYESAKDAMNVNAQLGAVIRSTGGIAGVSADQAIALAKSYQQMTVYGDEAILSTENMLLTFTNIGKDIFPQALESVLDISTAMGGDLQGAALQVGKALNNPIEGMSALTRVGVNFSDKQKDVIKSLVESGRGMEAQKIILAELTTEFGGSAKAMGDTTVGQIEKMKNSWDDFKEGLGQIGIWFAADFAGVFNGVLNSLGENSESFTKKAMRTFTTLKYNLSNPIEYLKFAWDRLRNPDADMSQSNFIQGLVEAEEKFNETWDAVTKVDLSKMPGGSFFGGANNFSFGDDTKKEADKAKSAFESLSKTVVNSLRDQEKAINSLRSAMAELDEQTANSQLDADERYNQQVIQMAKGATDKVADIGKQIADEEATMGQGWRARVAALQAEKAREQSIIDRANGMVSNLSGQMAKDDLDLLREKHTKEMAEISNQAAKKRKAMEDELAEREAFARRVQAAVGAPGFYAGAVAQSSTFLGTLGESSLQQQLVFNFNGTTVGDEGIRTLINQVIAALNRASTLRGVAGNR